MRVTGARRSHRARRHISGLALVVGCLIALAAPAVALAHPLGNFTINHYSGLRVAPDRITIDQVFDLAEIPALQALQPTGGDFGPGGADRYARSRCTELSSALALTVDGARQHLALIGAGATLPAGQGGLSTLRLVCTYEAGIEIAGSGPVDVRFVDGTFAERIGWREMVVEGDGVTVNGGDVPGSGVSARLTRYPGDLLSQPLDRSSVAFAVTDGGPRLRPLVVADAATILATDAKPSARAASMLPEPDRTASVPGGVTDLPPQLTELLRGDAMTPPLIALGLVVAIGLGAIHALTPGHGKTIMAAYLVGTRGDAVQAIGLGATVAISHTIGVLVLAMLVLVASSILPPERLFPILSGISAMLVTAIGAWLLFDAIRRIHGQRVHAHAHANDHPHPHDDHHGAHLDGPDVHEHGGFRHSHARPMEAGRPIRWRGIVTLGLAGGLIPSTSAILLLLGAVASGRPVLGLGLVVGFGLGMAGVLGVIGLLLVRARGVADRLPSVTRDGRLAMATSMAAATVVFGFGLLLVGQSFAALPL
ncbi:MAG: hypothetical protein ABWY52_05400 [Candidatus Limnocylindrales bacterium]